MNDMITNDSKGDHDRHGSDDSQSNAATKKPRFSIFHPYFMAFYSRDLYRDVILNWRGRGIFYIFVLTALLSIINTMIFHTDVVKFINQVEQHYLPQFPTITLNNGQLSIDRESPFVIKDIKDKKNIITIDTSGKYTKIQDVNTQVLITKHNIQAFNPKGQGISTMSFKQFGNITIDQNFIIKIGKRMAWGLSAFFFNFLWFFKFLTGLINMAILSWITTKIAHRRGISLDFKDGMRLAAIALTPIMIFASIGYVILPNVVLRMMMSPFILAALYINFLAGVLLWMVFLVAISYCFVYFGLNSVKSSATASQTN